MKWSEEVNFLREIIGSNNKLEETVKWGIPVFTYKGKNVVGVAKFKSYFGLWFYEGALLKDQSNLLVNAQKGKTKALRQIRFNSLEEVSEKDIKNYIKEAIQHIDEGRTFTPEKKKAVETPLELSRSLEKDSQLKASFNSLPSYKQKEYCQYIGEAKRAATREKRLEKSTGLILEGKGLNDKYR